MKKLFYSASMISGLVLSTAALAAVVGVTGFGADNNNVNLAVQRAINNATANCTSQGGTIVPGTMNAQPTGGPSPWTAQAVAQCSIP